MKILKLIHVFFTMGLVIFMGFVVFAVIGSIPELRITNATDDEFVFVILIPFISAIGFVLNKFLFGKLILLIPQKEDLKDKLNLYQTAMIVRLAIFEGITLLAIIATMLNENLFFLIIALAFLLYFISLHPTKNRVMKEMKIRDSEFQNLPDRLSVSNN